MMALLHKHRTFLLLLALVLMTSYNAFIYFFTAYPFNVPRNYYADPIPTRRDLVRKIMAVQREIEVRAEKTKDVDATWANRLLDVAAEMDPRVKGATIMPKASPINVARNSRMASNETTLLVCSEEYRGRDFDPDMKTNFGKIACNSPNFKDVLTILLPAKSWDIGRLKVVIAQIEENLDVNIVVITHGYTGEPLNGKNVITKRFGADVTESAAMKEVISNIETPYVFLAHLLVRFDSESDLERLVRVLEENHEPKVAAGAYRDAAGFWNHGCLQTTAENYKLEYLRGYEHSSKECMYCDDALGPFVARTDYLKSVYFTVSMEGPTMYRDWFLNIHLDRKLVVACPDVMFHVEAEPKLEEKDWFLIAQTWSFERIHSYDGKIHKYSCEDANISCKNLMKVVSSFLVAPCCREVFRNELQYVQDCAEEIGVHYELNAGSLLGAVKMDGMLPWDFDTDIITDCAEKDIWMSKGYECLVKKGCTLKTALGNYWTSTCNLSTVDLNCYDDVKMKLTPEYRAVPTKVIFNDVVTKVPFNPGRKTRNYYGEEYLKHAVHWRYSTNSFIPMDDGTGQTPGLWSNCIVPSFHSCIDHFPVDGNIKFHKNQCECT